MSKDNKKSGCSNGNFSPCIHYPGRQHFHPFVPDLLLPIQLIKFTHYNLAFFKSKPYSHDHRDPFAWAQGVTHFQCIFLVVFIHFISRLNLEYFSNFASGCGGGSLGYLWVNFPLGNRVLLYPIFCHYQSKLPNHAHLQPLSIP